jgi:hypothetical protein
MNASGRRQRQAKNGFKHLPPRKRPNYKVRDAAASRRHQDMVLATERRISQSSKKK